MMTAPGVEMTGGAGRHGMVARKPGVEALLAKVDCVWMIALAVKTIVSLENSRAKMVAKMVVMMAKTVVVVEKTAVLVLAMMEALTLAEKRGDSSGFAGTSWAHLPSGQNPA